MVPDNYSLRFGVCPKPYINILKYIIGVIAILAFTAENGVWDALLNYYLLCITWVLQPS